MRRSDQLYRELIDVLRRDGGAPTLKLLDVVEVSRTTSQNPIGWLQDLSALLGFRMRVRELGREEGQVPAVMLIRMAGQLTTGRWVNGPDALSEPGLSGVLVLSFFCLYARGDGGLLTISPKSALVCGLRHASARPCAIRPQAIM